jgi:nickel-dependent lactate racemase
MRVTLQYGTTGLDIDLPTSQVDVIVPRHVAGLPDEEAAFLEALRRPIEASPLADVVAAGDRVAVVIPDITRPLPSHRLLPWLLAELSFVPPENLTIIIGTGSHRAATPAEIAALVGPEVAARWRVVNHDAHDPTQLASAGRTIDGRDVLLNRLYVDADRRIVLGFIEPHFMAGFSGGYKGVFPALAGIDAVMHYHRAAVIGDPRSTWGMLDGNPTQEQIRFNGALLPVDFLINVTLNRRRELTGVFCGAVGEAHARGCAFAKDTAMAARPAAYPIVITSNSGAPLDQNLYQSVKGISAAAQIVADGGLILAAARCQDGFPAHGNFRQLLHDHSSPRAILDTILQDGFALFDQWQAQLLAIALLKARVGIYSEIPADAIRQSHMEPVTDIAQRVAVEIERLGRDARIAVLPEGPMTIPYLSPVPVAAAEATETQRKKS